MRILLVHNFYRDRTGEEIYLDSLAKLLRSKGHKVFIWSKDNREIRNSLTRKIKIAVGMFWNKSTEKELSGVIKRFKPDIAHFNNIFPQITPTAYYVCRRYKVPIAQTIHSFRFMFPKSILIRRGEICPNCLDKRLIYPTFLHRCYNQSLAYTFFYSLSHALHYHLGSFNLIDTFIFPSKFVRDYYLRNSNIFTQNTKVIPNFTNLKPHKLNLKEKEDYFLYVGLLSHKKGILQLLDIFSSLPEFRLVVIGDGHLRNEITEYNKYENIEIKGRLPQKEVFAYMRKALFTILPSTWFEVMPLVLIESFANGTPVIVPKIGPFIDLVKDGKTGIFFQPRDFSDLKAIIEKIGSKRLNLSMRMAPLVMKEYQKYTADNYYTQLLKVYSKPSRNPRVSESN
ncbi:glycosyltransferase family 4 protein [Patescibacteria group bacterium]|nr:glycosyltransferase family 4 protein [Patescibacteria group bacterium]MBU0777231.1 glycosyltransferase family 4 protein [Patescibacteria group bacterium]MBU0845926.1 glycosyltransferase family 4 protein [Patescibacteria group bacterium]MBU0922954.1 glycosyltransferase family 4 protein [Patescibacteria group bacterium]MBU1066196.1 glycosyltransferase family 4 protein [Patescibacteria group bacterium]